MCYGKCARIIGYSLLPLAVLCIVANILLYFPNGETKYASEGHLSKFVWFTGIAGGGLLVSRSSRPPPGNVLSCGRGCSLVFSGHLC